MAKKFGNFLIFTAAVGTIAAGVYYFLQKKNIFSTETEEDVDDFDDFSEDLDDDESSEKKRSYVSLNLDDNQTATESFEKISPETFIKSKTDVEKVEEFFDDDDENDSYEAL